MKTPVSGDPEKKSAVHKHELLLFHYFHILRLLISINTIIQLRK